jgi:citrate lyase gamma subunit
MKTIVADVRRAHPLSLTEIDIGTRPDLEEQFGTQIPVLLRGNQVIARYRVSTSQLIAALGQG